MDSRGQYCTGGPIVIQCNGLNVDGMNDGSPPYEPLPTVMLRLKCLKARMEQQLSFMRLTLRVASSVFLHNSIEFLLKSVSESMTFTA